MDEGTRLALRAIVRGLQCSGQLGSHAIAVIIDELRYAARDARDMLLDHDAAQIDLLAEELHGRADGGSKSKLSIDVIERLRHPAARDGEAPFGDRKRLV